MIKGLKGESVMYVCMCLMQVRAERRRGRSAESSGLLLSSRDVEGYFDGFDGGALTLLLRRRGRTESLGVRFLVLSEVVGAAVKVRRRDSKPSQLPCSALSSSSS